MSVLGRGGQSAAVSLGPEAQDRHAFCPDSFLRVEHAPCATHPLLSPEQPGFRLSAQGAGDTCITTGRCDGQGRLSCFATVSRT